MEKNLSQLVVAPTPTPTTPACPICFLRLTSKNRIRLECQHEFCQRCSIEWISQHLTCPLCRQVTHYYDRPLRSTFSKQDIITQFLYAMRKIPFENTVQYIYQYANVFDIFVLQQKPVWYRRIFYKGLQDNLMTFLSYHIAFLSHLEESYSLFQSYPAMRYSLHIFRETERFLSLPIFS